jgi:hypothetical protein
VRSGVKEFEVQGTRVTGERTPSARSAGSPLDMNQLNLDSDGAHQIAEREAKKVKFAYDYADYTLRAGTHGGSPVWELRLVDNQSGDAATITMAATTGKVLSTDGFTNRKKTPPIAQAPPDGGQEPVGPPAAAPQSGSQPLGVKVNKFFNRVGNHMDRRFRQLGDGFHNLFTGDNRDTAGPHHPPAEGTAQPRRGGSIDEDYTRPTRVRD